MQLVERAKRVELLKTIKIPGVELLVEAGMTPLEALQSATVNAAAMMNQPLPPADFVLLSANPLDDIRNTRKVEGVITWGKFSALGYAQ